MFLLDSLLVGGLRFVLDKVATVVDTEMNDESALHGQLLAAHTRLEVGEIGEAEFASLEADVLVRLNEIRRRRLEVPPPIQPRTTPSLVSMPRSRETNISRPRGRAPAGSATYIYCVVACARVPSTRQVPRGVPGATAPQPLALGPSLWAIAADVPLSRYASPTLDERLRDINWVADIAVQHESVVGYVASLRGVTVVPMKLFTMFSSEECALADLTARRRAIARVVKHVRGCQEWGVRIVLGETAPRQAAAARVASGTAFLAAKKRVRDEAQARASEAITAAEGTFKTLSALSRAAVARAAPDGAILPPLLDAAFLVTSGSRVRFRAAVRRAAADCRRVDADLVLTGPWPPYNFVAAPSGDGA